MTLGELVKKYRTEHELSLRDFSRLSGISNGYISMLEKNEHPKTKKPIVPSIEKNEMYRLCNEYVIRFIT